LSLPPDWRRLKLLLVVLASMTGGALLHAYGPALVRLLAPVAHGPGGAREPGLTDPRGPIGPVTLSGPQRTVTLPMEGPVIVNVWLQGCADCMPAFEAYGAIDEAGGLRPAEVPVVNVAFGNADAGWASRYGVAENLVFDPGGSAIVRPLGIGTFTTLVLDSRGYVRHRDRPNLAGYADRVTGAVRALSSAPFERSSAPAGGPRLTY
jgi:hypothetical protein